MTTGLQPITQHFKHVIMHCEPILPVEIKNSKDEGPFLAWKLLTLPEIYIGTIGVILAI